MSKFNDIVDSEPAKSAAATKMQFDDLNDDCLISIFKRLDVSDLISMCDVNKRYRSLIQDHVIARKTIDFDELDNLTAKIFKLFGKHMTKLVISEADVDDYPAEPKYDAFDRFLKLIINYGCEGKLTELGLGFIDPNFRACTQRLFTQAIPFFRNITKLNYINSRSMEFFNTFPLNNLRWLKLYRLRFTSNWLLSPALRNLQHLYVYEIDNVCIPTFKQFIQSRPRLKTLYIVRHDDLYFEDIARCIQDVEYIGFIKNCSEARKCLRNLNKLTKIDVIMQKTNGNDLYELLDCLPAKNALRELEICMPQLEDDNKTDRTSPKIMEQFTNLNRLKITGLHFECSPFLKQFLPHLSHVEMCTINKNGRFDGSLIIKMIKALKSLRVLAIETHLTFAASDYQRLAIVWKKRQVKEFLTYPIEISINKNVCLYDDEDLDEVYDEKVVVIKSYENL